MKEYKSKRLRVWENISRTMQEFKVVLLGYRSLTGLVSQSGTDAPTMVILENTLGLKPSFTYLNPGEYILADFSGLFAPNKTGVFMQFKNGGPTMELWVENQNEIYIYTDSQDEVLLNTFVEIRVYN